MGITVAAQQGGTGLIPVQAPFFEELACSPCVCVGFLPWSKGMQLGEWKMLNCPLGLSVVVCGP